MTTRLLTSLFALVALFTVGFWTLLWLAVTGA